jgi:hypothetical protein
MVFQSSSAQYRTVADEDPDSPTTNEKDFYRPPRSRRSCINYVSYALLVFALWAISIFIAVKISSDVVAKNCHLGRKAYWEEQMEAQSIEKGLATATSKLSCGSSSAEAEALGCVFDPLMASWLHKDCPSYGREEFAKLIKQDNLSYHYEENGKPTDKLIDMEAFPHMDGVMYWGTVMEHLTHCAYTLKRIIYTQHEHGRFDTVTGNFSHTDHCVEFLISGLKTEPANLTEELYRTDMPISFLEC